MSHEVWKMVKSNEADNIELQLALQCAPLITGMKTSNLLNICRGDFGEMVKILRDSHISWYVLLVTGEKMMVLLYQKHRMEEYFCQERVWRLLRQNGYVCSSLEEVLREFSVRYEKYMRDRGDFPHEMGVLLGYPVEDVEGFIQHRGAHFLCRGYWKVYANKEKKIRLFEKYEQAKERLIQLLFEGVCMKDIIRICGQHEERKTVPIKYMKTGA